MTKHPKEIEAERQKELEEKQANWKIEKDMDELYKEELYSEFITGVLREYTKEEMEIINEIKDKRRKDLLEKYDVWQEDKSGNLRPNPACLGNLIYNEHGHFFTIIDNKTIYTYNDEGYYEKTGDALIRNLVEYYLGDYARERHKNETVGWIRDANYFKRENINVPLNLINLRNGILNIETRELLPHSPEYLFLGQLPVNYDPKASYKNFEDFLKHISMNEGKIREKVVNTIQEYLGYGIYRAYPFKNYMVLDGGGDNGKTALLNIVIALFGEKNNTSVSLQELNSRPFAKKQLYAKHVNVSDDLPKKALKFTGVIKQITGNSVIWADIKGHKDGINFRPFAKPWYACNELPETTDYTDAFFSRQLQITLLNKYLPKGDQKIDNVTVFERDINIVDKLTTNQQLSGILNYILIGLQRLLENKIFSDDTTTDEKRTIWMRKTNPVHAFVEDEIEIAGEDWCITIEDFFSELVAYCERNEFDKPTARKPVTTRLLDENIGVKKLQKTIGGVPHVWCWIGIKSSTNSTINHYIGKAKDGVLIWKK